MKKALALLLALLMVLSLVACGGNGEDAKEPSTPSGDTTPAGDDNTGDETPAVTEATPNMNEDGTPNLDRIAYYDRNYDYTQNEKFKVMYLAASSSFLYQMGADAYAHWAPLFNCEWCDFVSSEGDSDLYMTQLQQNIDSGVQGFVLDPDNTIFPAVAELLTNYPEIQWMSQMSPPRDGETGDGLPVGGNMIHPYIGFDNYEAGAQQVLYLDEWRKANIPDASWDEIGLACFTYSVSPPLAEREVGARETFEKVGGNMDNYTAVDCVSGGLTQQSGIDTFTPVVTNNPNLKYWLIVGLIDDFAQGAAVVVDQAGLTDNSCITAFGGAGWIAQTDAGQQNAFRAALFTANNLYSEPILGCVYAFLMGWATPETIFPSWIKENDHGGEGHTYASVLLPTCWLEPDTYQQYLEWSDWYAKADAYKYDVEIKGDEYSPFVEVPSEGYIAH